MELTTYLLFFIFFFSGSRLGALVRGQVISCYGIDGNLRGNNTICPGSDTCCGVDATCLSNRLCYNPGEGDRILVRGPCSKKDFRSNDCPQICLDSESPGSSIRHTMCFFYQDISFSVLYFPHMAFFRSFSLINLCRRWRERASRRPGREARLQQTPNHLNAFANTESRGRTILSQSKHLPRWVSLLSKRPQMLCGRPRHLPRQRRIENGQGTIHDLLLGPRPDN